MDESPWVDIGGKGTVHGHTEHMLLFGDHCVAVLTTEVCKLLKIKHKRMSSYLSGDKQVQLLVKINLAKYIQYASGKFFPLAKYTCYALVP